MPKTFIHRQRTGPNGQIEKVQRYNTKYKEDHKKLIDQIMISFTILFSYFGKKYMLLLCGSEFLTLIVMSVIVLVLWIASQVCFKNWFVRKAEQERLSEPLTYWLDSLNYE